jgi:hypothetical protein
MTALWILLAVSTYLRPGQMFSLTMERWRSSEEVRRRGSWKSPRSITRYVKHARLVDSLARRPGGLRRHMDQVEGAIEDIVLKDRVEATPSLVALLAG